MESAVITGPTGAIGLALIKKCIAEGIQVLAIVRKYSSRKNRIPKSPLVHIVECDLRELKYLDKSRLEREKVTQSQYDVFYHFGWSATIGDGRNDMRLQSANIEYSLDAVELAERLGCHTFIGAGSQAEYGRREEKLSEDTPAFPENGYGIAKLCAGQMTRIECGKRGIKHIWTRILSVYGPGDGEKTMISSTIRKLLSGEKPSLTAGEQMWDYLYSEDAARALYMLGDKGKSGKTYCIGSGQVRPLREYIELLRDCIDEDLPLGIGEVPYREKQVMYLCADISALARDTGFVPEVDFKTGIKRTIDWFKQIEIY